MKEEEYPNLTTVAIIALMPAQGLMRGDLFPLKKWTSMTPQNTPDMGGFVPTMTDFADHDFIIVLFLRSKMKLERVMGIGGL